MLYVKYYCVQIKKVFYWLSSKQYMSNHISLCQEMRFLLTFPKQLVNLKYSAKFSLRAWKRSTNYVVCNYVCRDNANITGKKVSKVFSYDDVVKCCWNLNFGKIPWILRLRYTGKKWWILNTVRNIYGVHQTKYYYGSVKKRKCSFNRHLQVDKESIL